MIGLGKVLKAVTGGDRDARAAAPVSSIARDVTATKAVPVLPAWDAADAAPSETRAAERFVPHKTGTILTTVSGKRIAARIINISQVGVALEAELSEHGPRDIATVGTRPVVPGRRIALGMVFLFKKPLDPKLCSPDIIL